VTGHLDQSVLTTALANPICTEVPLDSAQVIIDAHHHLYDRPGHRYLLDEFRKDLDTGHNVKATVYVQARERYRQTGPEALRPVGETEFAHEIAEETSRYDFGNARVCAGIVGFANLLLGQDVAQVLESHIGAGGGRFRGIRQIAAWDVDRAILNPAYPTTADMLESDAFLTGFAQLAPMGLSFDAWVFFHQLPRLTQLARRFPETSIIVDHCGGVLGTAGYEGQREAVFSAWLSAMRELAKCPNVSIKLSGLGMRLSNFKYRTDSQAPNSEDLARSWKPWMQTCIELFGPSRCMFASNFPVDKACYGYSTGWNAMQRVCAGASPEDIDYLFFGTAARTYKIDV
jgi:L-fuconolactonase